jgi:arylformamidase
MDLEAEYDNRARVPGHPAIIAAWQRDAGAYRAAAAPRAELALAYGARERNRLDLFRSAAPQPGAPLVVFIHGGYWRAFDPGHFSHLAAGANARGLDVALPGYSLCPAVSVPDIIDELRQAVLFLWHRERRPLVVMGHSAGGHLAACLMATGWTAFGAPAGLVANGFGVSGLYDLRPLMATSINLTLRLDETAALQASPLLWPGPPSGRFDAWVGAEESAEYLRQSRSLAAAWQGVGRAVGYREVRDANHFSIIAALAEADSPMTRNLALLCGL